MFADNENNIINQLRKVTVTQSKSPFRMPRERFLKQQESFQLATENNELLKNHFAFFTLEEIPSILTNPVSALNDFKDNNIVVLFPLVPAEDRLFSLIMRKNEIIDNGLINCSDNVDDYIRTFFDWHMYVSTGKKHDTKHINFDHVILMRDFERLLDLHLKGKLKLLILSKDTILNNEQKIFEKIGIPETKHILFEHKEWLNREKTFMMNRRMEKMVDIERQEVFDKIMNVKSDIIEKRYQEIYRLIDQHGLEII